MSKEKKLSMKFDPDKILVGQFIAGIRSFFDVINDVTKDITKGERIIRWNVSVEQGSTIISAIPELLKGNPEIIDEVITTIGDGMKNIQKHSVQPRHYTLKALTGVRNIAKLVSSDDGGIEKIGIRFNGEWNYLTHEAVAHVDELCKIDFKDWGSIEGKLEMITQRNHFLCEVYDAITDCGVRCNLTEEIMDKIKYSFGKRVIVYGLIKYRKGGNAISIDVKTFRTFREKGEIPKANDVLGILKDE